MREVDDQLSVERCISLAANVSSVRFTLVPLYANWRHPPLVFLPPSHQLYFFSGGILFSFPHFCHEIDS